MQDLKAARTNIKLKAMVAIRNGNKVLVNEVREKDGSLSGFRIPGGHVEFRELSADTAVREMSEEIGAEIVDLKLLSVIENLFTYFDKDCHEVIFVYQARFADESLNDRSVIEAQEDDGAAFKLYWHDPDALPEGVKLFPLGLRELLK